MMLSVMVMSTGAVTITDADDISPQYAEAAEVLTGMGIINGYEDDSFQPQNSIKRSEVAAMIYRAATSDVEDNKVDIVADSDLFTDVNPDDWYAGYVNYCGDAEYIKGYEDDTFRADNNVTGYEVLAMILRALGYDSNKEFTGPTWTINVVSTATDVGMLKNLDNSVDLAVPASREVVAELIFRAIEPGVDTVHYSPAAGDYLSDRDGSLGQQKFDLASKPDADVWGRPNVEWYKANTSTVYATIEQDAVYTNNVKVDECDIAEAIGLTKAADIEAAYIDGELQTKTDSAVTTDRDGDIDPLATTSLVGAQGRQLEIYDMGDAGYRIVEINTYLAVVDKVTASTTDKNGHTTDATVDLTVFLKDNNGIEMKGVVASGFSVNDYVLVQVSNPTVGKVKPVVESIELAPVVAGGEVDGWTAEDGTTAATTTVGDETYTEANKFFVGRHENGIFNVLTDNDGNVIGLVKGTTNYLVVEAVRWIGDSTLYGGHAVADVVLATGERVSNVTIASVNGDAANHHSATAGKPADASFDTSYADNGAYYNHIWSYTVNADGAYALGENNGHDNSSVNKDTVDSFDLTSATITKGQTIISGTLTDTTTSTPTTSTSKSVGINDSTVFVVKDADEYTYTTYVGKENVPSMTGAKVCYIAEGNYATFVVVTEYALDSNTFAAYVDVDAAATGRQTDLGYAFTVYKVGEDTATTVYYGTTGLPLNFANDGIYSFTVNEKMQLVDNNGLAYGEAGAGTIQGTIIMDVLMNGNTTPDVSGTHSFDGYTWDRNFTKSNDGNNMYVTSDNANTYWVDNAQYILVSYDSNGKMTDIETAAYSDVTWSETQQVLVAYKTVNTVKQAAYVYVIDQAEAPAVTPTTGNIQVKTLNNSVAAGSQLKNVEFEVSTTVSGASQNLTITSVTWERADEHGDWQTCSSDSIIVAGETYRATITVTAPDGVQLSDTISATWDSATASINGNVITYQFTR